MATTYVPPNTRVFQDFAVVPAPVANSLNAFINGGHAKLIRYAETDERELGRLDYYDDAVDSVFNWPNRPAGGIVDPTYTKVWIKNALLKYFEDTVASGSTITKTNGYNNRVRSATINFADNGEYSRHSSLLDRDVKVGDTVKVRGLDSNNDSFTLITSVKRLIGDVVAASIDDASTDTSNSETQSGTSSVLQLLGAENCITLTPDISDYDGYPSGFITETYDILVVESSVGNDLTTASIRIISGSGDDDVESMNPEAAGELTTIGTRGLAITFDTAATLACSSSADVDDVSPDDLIAGQRWRVTVNQAFTKPVPTSGGTYDSEQSTTYIVTVTRGGLYTAVTLPQITVTTSTGVDLGGPTTVSAAATAVDVGTNGATIAFTGSGLRLGDRYYIEVFGSEEGPMRTIELSNNLSVEIAGGSEVDVTLYIRKDVLQIEQNRTGAAPETNWDVSDTQITINSGITAYDESWTDEGVPEPLDVVSIESKSYGMVYVEYRAWLADLTTAIFSIQDPGELNDQISGALDPDNPLKYGVFKALESAGGAEVKYCAVTDPDDETAWADSITLLLGREDSYGLVPLTRNQDVLDLYNAHVNAASSPEEGLWRVLWVSLSGLPEVPVVAAGSSIPGHINATTTDGEVCLAVIEDDSLSSGTQYTIIRCTSGNGDFVTNNVGAGDIVRTLYTGDGFGNYIYSEYVVDEVISEDELRLLVGPDAGTSTPAKIEVWRNLNSTQEAAEIGANAGAWGSRRVRAVWPDRQCNKII